MNPWLQMALCLAAFFGIAFGLPSLLELLAVHLDKQRPRFVFAPCFPCTRWFPAAPRNPALVRVGDWALACSQSHLDASCTQKEEVK